MKYTQEQLDKIYDKLPEEMKGAISSIDTANFIREISKKHSLPIDKMSSLANETGLVMLGLLKTSDFTKAVKENLQIDTTKAQAIVKDVDEKIFSSIKDSLKQVQTESNFIISDKQAQAPDTTDLNIAGKIKSNALENNLEITPLEEKTVKENTPMTMTESLPSNSSKNQVSNEEPSREDLLKEIESEENSSIEELNISNENSLVGQTTPKEKLNGSVPDNLPIAKNILEDKLENISIKTETSTEINEVGKNKKGVGGEKIDPYQEPID